MASATAIDVPRPIQPLLYLEAANVPYAQNKLCPPTIEHREIGRAHV